MQRIRTLVQQLATTYDSGWLPPDDVYYNNKPDKPERDAKTVSANIEQHYFRQTRIMGYRLKKVA